MKTVRDLHNEAMRLTQAALIARQNEEGEKAIALLEKAYDFESQAADFVPNDKSSEPTRSILYRSAASLAFQCYKFYDAKRLVIKGLSGYPPPKIEKELNDLYQQINFEFYLKNQGILMEEEDLQFSLKGTAVGSGNILFDELLMSP